jgi:rRNA-processing protein FCF1
MDRYLIDSMILDRIAETVGALDLVQQLRAAEQVELVVTHIQEDEIAEIKDARKRAAISAIPRTVAATYGFVVGVSRVGMARLGEDHPIEAIRGSNWQKYTNDALIAATAQFESAVLVTDDRRLRTRAVRELGIEALGWPAFHGRLEAAAAARTI